MRLTILMALFVSIWMPMGRPMHAKQDAVAPLQTSLAQASEVRLLIRGGTAQWGFQFACVGAHCRFLHTRVMHRFQQAQYVNLAVRFSGVSDHQGDAALWLRRVSAKKESAAGN